MAKRSTQKRNKNKKQASRQTVKPPRGFAYLFFLGFLLAAWVIWRLEPQGLGRAILWGGGLAAAWWIFVGLYYWSLRRGDNKD